MRLLSVLHFQSVSLETQGMTKELHREQLTPYQRKTTVKSDIESDFILRLVLNKILAFGQKFGFPGRVEKHSLSTSRPRIVQKVIECIL